MSIYINGEEIKKYGKKLKISTILKDKKLKKKLPFKCLNRNQFLKKALKNKE